MLVGSTTDGVLSQACRTSMARCRGYGQSSYEWALLRDCYSSSLGGGGSMAAAVAVCRQALVIRHSWMIGKWWTYQSDECCELSTLHELEPGTREPVEDGRRRGMVAVGKEQHGGPTRVSSFYKLPTFRIWRHCVAEEGLRH